MRRSSRRGFPVKRTTTNAIIDLSAAITFLGLLVTGYIIRFPLPAGSGRSHVLWGMGRHDWGAVHFWISVAFLLILVVHLALHWEWVIGMIRKRFSARTRQSHRPSPWLLGLVAAVLFLFSFALFAWMAHASVRDTRGEFGDDRSHHLRQHLNGVNLNVASHSVSAITLPKMAELSSVL